MATALDSELRNLSLHENSIKPGLFHLSLDLLSQHDSDILNEKKNFLDIKLEEEHQIFHPILKNLIALINHRLPTCQNEVIDILERTLKESPNHLNTLANLEVIYQELNQNTESDRCRQAKDDILCRNDSQAQELKAQCVLEQALSLHIEGITNQDETGHRLRDLIKNVLGEHDRSTDEPQENLGTAVKYTEQESPYVVNAIEKFLHGLKMLESIGKEKTLQYRIWNYCFGLALNRCTFLISQEEDHTDRQTIGIEVNTKMLQVFWNTICNLNAADERMPYIARSYAYIGHLLISKKDTVGAIVKNDALHIDKRSELMALIRDPLNCFRKASELRPKDAHVLSLHGRSLKNKAYSESRNDDDKFDLLLQAHDYLTKSIDILPHNNRSAYVARMKTRRDLALLSWGPRMKGWLEDARLDGIKCYKSKATDADLCTLAKVCQMLAKYPDVKKHGSKFVKDKRYIEDAILYLNHAIQLGRFENFEVAFTLSLCLHEIKKHRTAIEWMKRAMQWERRSKRSVSLPKIAQYVLDLYSANISEGNTPRLHLFNEMQFWIDTGKAKSLDISHTIFDLFNYNDDGMHDFTTYLLSSNLSNTESRRSLIALCLAALTKRNGNRRRDQETIKLCREKLQDLRSSANTFEQDRESSVQYTTPDIVMPYSLDAKIQHSKFKNDFFVSYSNVNRDWVNHFLLHQLETKLHDNDTAFKGCIADRDFTPGRPIISNIRAAVEHSCKIIFVVTEAFIKSRWCDFEVDSALIEMLSTKDEDCIIPILLEKVEDQRLPKKLSHTFLDLTDESNHFKEIMKLKKALLIEPGRSISAYSTVSNLTTLYDRHEAE